MKKILSVFLMLCLVLTLAACSKNDSSLSETDSGNSETDSGTSAEVFVKPEHYTSVLLVTINPQFRLYLDESGKVLAMEAVNKDAESIMDNISFENENYETVIENIVTTANEKGFVKADATINFEIVESQETNNAQADILANAEKTANETAVELKIEVTVNTVEIKPDDTPSPSETESDDTPISSEPVHTHSFSPATCTEPAQCECGAIEGAALGHDYKDGVCSRCNAADPDFKFTSISKKQGKWILKYLNQKDLYSVFLKICNPAEYSAGVGIGVLLSSLPQEMQNDAKPMCEEFNDTLYYIGMGTGDSLNSVTEKDNTVTLTDSSGNQLILTRTGDNTLRCDSAPDIFAGIEGIPVGAEFTFVAE